MIISDSPDKIVMLIILSYKDFQDFDLGLGNQNNGFGFDFFIEKIIIIFIKFFGWNLV